VISEDTRAKWRDEARFLEAHVEKLNPREAALLESVRRALQQGRDISFKQSSYLRGVHHRLQEKLG